MVGLPEGIPALFKLRTGGGYVLKDKIFWIIFLVTWLVMCVNIVATMSAIYRIEKLLTPIEGVE